MHERKVRNLHRWFQIVAALNAGDRPTAGELAQRFGVSERTIFRDLDNLEQMGIPIVRHGGRYTLLETYRLKPVQFTADEVLALTVALDFARRRSNWDKAALSARDKLLGVLPPSHRELAAGLDATMVIDPLPGHSAPAQPEVERVLQRALQGAHPVRLSYQKLAAAAPEERVVEPYGFAYRGTSLYLIGFCRLRQAIRTFRVNRIQSAVVLTERFAVPVTFDLEAYLAEMWGIEDGPLMYVRVRFFPEVARLALETVWHPSQAVTREEDGSVLLEMETRGMNELARWLAGYGASVQVLDPPELRAALRRLGEEIVRRYSPAP